MVRWTQRIQFFTSVKSSEFPWTDNESIHLLKLYIHEMETKFESIPKQERETNNTIQIGEIYQKFKNAQELVTYYQVMQNRGWTFDAVKNS